MQIDWWTLALQTVNFLVLVWLLHRFLFQPVRRLIETRKAKLDAQLHSASDARVRAESEAARHAALIEAFEADRDSAAKAFQQQLDADRDAAMAKAQDDADTLIAASRKQIARDRRDAIRQSRDDIIGLARDMASSILADRAAGSYPAPDLAAAMRRFRGLPDRDRQRIVDHVTNDTTGITVVTAVDLDRDGQSAVSRALETEFGARVHVEFRVDGDLLGGVQIQLPQARLDASWASYLDAATERLLEADDDDPEI